jgi:TRAP-type C4-dicarboxylate transport system permease small subunit
MKYKGGIMEILRRIGVLFNAVFVEISSWLCLLVTLLVSLDVILRYLFKGSIPAGVELTQVLLVFMVYLVLGAVQEKKEHIRVDFFIDKISPRAKQYWEMIVCSVALVFLSIIFVFSIESFLSSFEMKEHYGGVIRIPIYPSRAAIFIGIGLMMAVLGKEIVLLLSAKGKGVIIESPEQKEIEEVIEKIEKNEKK